MKNIVIIGAGPAGLTAAHTLLSKTKHQYIVRVLEASTQIGGISKTLRYKNNRIDIGGHRFFSKNQQVCDWWKSRLPLQGMLSKDDTILGRQNTLSQGGPDPEKEHRVMLIRKRFSRIFFNSKFFDYPLKLNIRNLLNFGFFKLCAISCSYLYAQLFKRPEKSLEDFYINRFGKSLYAMFFKSYTEKVWGKPPSQLSADWGAQRVKGLSLTKLFVDSLKKCCRMKTKTTTTETSLIEEFWYPKFGPGQLWEQTALEIRSMGGVILHSHEVVQIFKGSNNSYIVTCRVGKDLKSYKADIVISSMALRDLINAIQFDIPPKAREVGQNLQYRDFITVGVLTNKLKLKNTTSQKTFNNIVPDCWLYIQDNSVKLQRIQIFNNWSPYLVNDVEHTVWLGLEYCCNESDELWNMTDEELKALAVKELILLKMVDLENVLDLCVERVKKAYPTYFGSYDNLDVLHDWLLTLDNFYCVGRNGQHRYNNMDHSMLTAFSCVDHILLNSSDKSQIFKVNTDSEYHEERVES